MRNRWLAGVLVATAATAMMPVCEVHGGDSVEAAQVFMVGHSLVNFDMPTMLAALAEDAGKTHQRGEQITIGAPLIWNWNHADSAQGLNARKELPTGAWDVLVLTEAIPLQNHLAWSQTYQYAGHFHQLALDARPDTRTFVYETWHCIDSGTPAGCAYDDNDHMLWRQRLDEDRSKWQGIADYLNENHVGPAVELVPAGQALALAHDRILDGMVPDFDHVFELFSDDIHLTDAGHYFVALVMFASIYGESPEGLTHQISNQWGTAYALPSADSAMALQMIAWQAVQRYRGIDEPIFTDGFEGPSATAIR